jgi:DNA-binding XRE family transcriptional regulator
MTMPSSKSKASGPLEQIGTAIRSGRVLRRLTQAELADAIGVSRPTVVAAEAGRSVSSHNLFALMGHLGMRLMPSSHGAANQVRRRPNIAELVSVERVRRQRLAVPRGRSAAPGETLAAAGTTPNPLRAVVASQVRSARPRIGDLIAAERQRRTLPASTAT